MHSDIAMNPIKSMTNPFKRMTNLHNQPSDKPKPIGKSIVASVESVPCRSKPHISRVANSPAPQIIPRPPHSSRIAKSPVPQEDTMTAASAPQAGAALGTTMPAAAHRK